MTPAEYARMVNATHAIRPDWPWTDIAANTEQYADLPFPGVAGAIIAEAVHPQNAKATAWTLTHLGVNPRRHRPGPAEVLYCQDHLDIVLSGTGVCTACKADLIAATPDEAATRRAEVQRPPRTPEQQEARRRELARVLSSAHRAGNGHLDEPTTRENVA